MLNRYSFERNNPYGRIDPTGHIAPAIGVILIGALFYGTVLLVRWASNPVAVANFFGQRYLDIQKLADKLGNRLQEQRIERERQKVLEASDKARVEKGSPAANDDPFKIQDNANPADKEPINPNEKTNTDPPKAPKEETSELEIDEKDSKNLQDPELITQKIENQKAQIKEKEDQDSSGSSKNGGRMSYEERLAKHLRLVKESNRRERRCKKTC